MSKEFAIQAACLSLFLGMILAPVVCYRLGRRKQQEEDRHAEVSGAVTGAIFALLGLLIAFTFSGAHARFDARRQLIVQEANAIGTTYLRLDLVPASAQPPLREKLKSYATSRAVFYHKITDVEAARSELARATALQQEIWKQAVSESADPNYQSARMLLLPALNDMIDIITTRTAAIQTHPPFLIWCMLFAIALACAGLTRYRAGLPVVQASLIMS